MEPGALLAKVRELVPGVAQSLSSSQLSSEDMELVQQALQQRAHAEHCASVRQAEMERQADEYEAETQRLHEQLRTLGLPLDKLSPSARGALHTLATIASDLQLAHPTQPAMVAAWVDLSLRDMRSALMQSKVEQHSAALMRSLARAEQGAQNTRSAMAAAAAAQVADVSNHEAMKVRLKDFEERIKSYKEKEEAMSRTLARKGLRPELKHHALVEAARQYDELQAELQSAQAELAEYHNLPASQVGAEQRLQQLEQRCMEAKAQLQRGMQDLN